MGEQIKSIYDLGYDEVTQYLVTIDTLHYETHEGSHYRSEHVFQLAAGAKGNVYFKAPASSVEVHATVEFTASGAGAGEVRESATVTLSGTVLTAFNLHRQKQATKLTGSTVRHTPTLTASGTLLPGSVRIGGGLGRIDALLERKIGTGDGNRKTNHTD